MSEWYEKLERLRSTSTLSIRQVAQLSGIPNQTLVSWFSGKIKAPRIWQPLTKVLAALNATTSEANSVLISAGFGPVGNLQLKAKGSDRLLLEKWIKSDSPFMAPDRFTATIVGRENEISAALKALKNNQRVIILGMGGVGKTTIGLELAHQLREWYPDGTLWGDFRTSTAESIVESWGQVLDIQLAKLADFPSRAARLRTILSNKKLLVIFDDAVESEIIHQLMPASHSQSGVIVTTRLQPLAQSLTLPASNNQRGFQISLRPLSRQSSNELIAKMVGQEIFQRELSAANRLATFVGDLPLALNLCGALCSDTGLTLTDLVEVWQETQTQLGSLPLDDLAPVRVAFEQSWIHLNRDEQQGMMVLAIFEGRPFSTAEFSACLNISEGRTKRILARLVQRSLLNLLTHNLKEQHNVLYQQHTLLAAFSAEKIHVEDPAWSRFVQYFTQQTSDPNWWRNSNSILWGHLYSSIRIAHRLKLWEDLLKLSIQLAEGWNRLGLYSDARQGYAPALEAAYTLDDSSAKALIYLHWGRACLEQADFVEAQSHLDEALKLFEQQNNIKGQADSHYHLSWIHMKSGQFEIAKDAVQTAYHTYQQEEDLQGMARSLYRLADITYFQGESAEALELVLDAIPIQEQIDDEIGLLRSHILAAFAYMQLEKIGEALIHCQLAENLVDIVSDQSETAAFYHTYADLLRRQGEFQKAREYGHQALSLCKDMGDLSSAVMALNLLAGNEVRWNRADPDRDVNIGLNYCIEALDICNLMGYRFERAYILLMQGHLLLQNGQSVEACTAWSQGDELAQDLNLSWLKKRLDELTNENCPHL